MDKFHRHSALAYCGGAPLDRATAHVASREYSRQLVSRRNGSRERSRVAHLDQHALQRRLIDDLSREDSFAVLQIGYHQPIEPLRPVPLEVSFHPDLVNGRLSSS